jgi:hypothetical protein
MAFHRETLISRGRRISPGLGYAFIIKHVARYIIDYNSRDTYIIRVAGSYLRAIPARLFLALSEATEAHSQSGVKCRRGRTGGGPSSSAPLRHIRHAAGQCLRAQYVEGHWQVT